MRYLIDGYNLMYAGGLLGKRFGPDGFRKVRTRFLNDLAAALGAADARETTVVFDAAAAPDDVPSSTRHKGLSVVYAVDSESADERIEELIAGHSAPKSLSVVSTDRRIRQAATRRKARAVTADAFLDELDTRKRKRAHTPFGEARSETDHDPAPRPDARPTPPPLTAEESEYWLHEFGDLGERPETREALNAQEPLLTPEEVEEIERQVDREMG